MKQLILLFLICTFSVSYTETNDFIVKDLKSLMGKQKFPFVINNTNSKIAEKNQCFLAIGIFRKHT